MRNLRGIVSLAVVLFAIGARPGAAQTPAPAFDDLLAEAHRGKTVYVTDHTGATVKGRVVKISPQSIELLVQDGSREWPAADVAWVTERRRHRRGDQTEHLLYAGPSRPTPHTLSPITAPGVIGVRAQLRF
jgi:hypothetical protein